MSPSAIQLPNTLCVEVLTDEAEFDALENDWDELLDESNQRVYFLRWSWNRLWWRIYAPWDSRLFLIACYEAPRRLVGMAPFYWRRHPVGGIASVREVLFLGTGIDITTSEQLDLISRRGYERAVAEAVANSLLQAEDVDRLLLRDIPITSVILPHFRRAIGERHSVWICNRSHHINTCADWATLRQDFGKSTRAKIERCLRRVLKVGDYAFRCVETEEELEPAMKALVHLHQARWQSKGAPGSFALPGVELFLREAMRSSLAAGRLRLWTLAVNGETAAALLAFFDNGIANYFQGGFDPKYAKYSLGTVMFALCIQACVDAREVMQFNFMGGDPAYKEHWTKLGLDSVALEWLRPGVRSTVFQAYESGESRVRFVLRAVLPDAIRAARRKRFKSK